MSGVDIIDLIDGAIADWETSDDAMRWTPDPPVEPFIHRFTASEAGWYTFTSAPAGPRGPSFDMAILDEAFTINSELLALQLENLRAAFRSLTLPDVTGIPEIFRAASGVLRPALEQLGEGLREVGRQATATLGLVQAVEELDCQPATKGAAAPVPVYRDRRPRWQSPYGPQARRRG